MNLVVTTSNKPALITAAGSGMGAAIASRLAADGYQVAVMSSSGKGEALGKQLGGIGFTGSVNDPAALKAFVDLAQKKFGRIDAVVNSAGHPPKGELLDLTRRAMTHRPGHGAPQRRAHGAPGHAGDAGAKKRRHRQHLHLRLV